MIQILYEEYKKNKLFVLGYISICVFFAVFFGPFINNYFSATACATAGATTLTEAETLSTLTKQLLGNSISAVAGSYASVVAISCEPFTALLFLGIIENVNRLCGYPLDMISTPAGNPIVLLVIAIFFAASKLMKSNETTQIFGMVTLGELEKYLGLVFILVLGILNVTGISTGVMNAVVSAASPEAVAGNTGAGWVTAISVAFSVFLAILSLAVYFIMKTVMSGLDVIQVSLSFIPGSAFFFETMKSLFAIFLVFVNVICPPLGIVLNIIIFIIGCFLFKMCYRATRYFDSIYVRPILKRIKGFDPQISLITKKFPKRIRKYCETQNIPVEMALPVFPLKYVGEEKVHKYERWYLVINKDNAEFMRKRMGKKRVRRLSWENTYQQPVYIRKGLWYFEVFAFLPDANNMAKKRPKKEFSFALSMEYFYRFEDILKMTGYENYNVIQDAQKLTKKQQKEEKRLRRKEAILMKLDNIKQKTGLKQEDNQRY